MSCVLDIVVLAVSCVLDIVVLAVSCVLDIVVLAVSCVLDIVVLAVSCVLDIVVLAVSCVLDIVVLAVSCVLDIVVLAVSCVLDIVVLAVSCVLDIACCTSSELCLRYCCTGNELCVLDIACTGSGACEHTQDRVTGSSSNLCDAVAQWLHHNPEDQGLNPLVAMSSSSNAQTGTPVPRTKVAVHRRSSSCRFNFVHSTLLQFTRLYKWVPCYR